ncbi:MAG: hypothetical protein KTR32_01940 [Granulosicoccus sp.]|nr:hypothetical protein [Granulosicoccus sp.]
MSDKGWQGSIDNLLVNCVGGEPNQHLLIVEEPESEDMYEPGIGSLIAERAKRMGLTVSAIAPDLVKETADIPMTVSEHMRVADHTLFLSRIGDIARFTPLSGNGSKTICYARRVAMFDSYYANSCHKLMSVLLDRLENTLHQAESWQIECALGTNVTGHFNWSEINNTNDFTLSFFPVTTFTPVTCDSASGNVALSRWLMPGGATKVGPDHVPFQGIVNAAIENGVIQRFEGDPAAVETIQNHYALITNALGVNRNRVHSWHAGINPHTFYDSKIEENFECWNATSFSSPRYLHFHTCGDLAPCEITWSVFNPTVMIDGEVFWENGNFVWLQRPENRQLILNAGQSQLLEPSADIGL